MALPKVLALALSVLVLACPVYAGTVDLIDPLGNDSGWSVDLPDDTHYGIFVNTVSTSDVDISIGKEFYPGGPKSVFFEFYQRSGRIPVVPEILIEDENIVNTSGAAWIGYGWAINGMAAAFNRPATGVDFSIAPFTTRAWGSTQPGWDDDHPMSLSVGGGVVPNGGIFIPGNPAGALHIDVNPLAETMAFSLIQTPTVPEPATLALLVASAGYVLRRHRRAG